VSPHAQRRTAPEQVQYMSSETASADCRTLMAEPDSVVSRTARPTRPPLISYASGMPNMNSVVESACPLEVFISR
jgi:hypothetical protein